MDRPFVSVVLPFHDAEAFLAMSIESILDQDYPFFELVMVDDGSRDGSAEIASRYLSRNVTLLRQSNKGVGHAISSAIDLSRGAYVFLNGADDVSERDRLSRGVELFESRQVDVVACRPDIIDGSGAVVDRAVFPLFERDVDLCDSRSVFAELFHHHNFICAPAAAIRRTMVSAVGAVHAGLIQLQDFDYWLRAAAHGAKFHVEGGSWLKYRWHDSNLSQVGNIPRSQREFQYVYRHLPCLMSSDLSRHLWQCSPSQDIDMAAVAEAPAFVLHPQIFMAHRRPEVRQIGYEMLMAIFGDREKARVFERFTNLSPSHAFALMQAEA